MTSIISSLPFTLANGAVADASQVMADLNQIRNDVNNNAQPKTNAYRGAAVYNSGSETGNSDAYTVISFTDAVVNTDSIFNVSLHPTRLTTPSGVSLVRILFQAVLLPQDASPVNYFVQIIKNGSTGSLLEPGAVGNSISITNAALISAASAPQAVSPGDYFEMEVYGHDSHGTFTIGGCFFEMQILG